MRNALETEDCKGFDEAEEVLRVKIRKLWDLKEKARLGREREGEASEKEEEGGWCRIL